MPCGTSTEVVASTAGIHDKNTSALAPSNAACVAPSSAVRASDVRATHACAKFASGAACLSPKFSRHRKFTMAPLASAMAAAASNGAMNPQRETTEVANSPPINAPRERTYAIHPSVSWSHSSGKASFLCSVTNHASNELCSTDAATPLRTRPRSNVRTSVECVAAHAPA